MAEVLKGQSCEVQVICDSISPDNIRLTTLQLRYWRPIHSELMTHRVFSRNARSSRAVPVATLLKETPYRPHFMQNRPGMQALEELPKEKFEAAVFQWEQLIEQTRDAVRILNALGVHKQWANRPLEWFGWIDVLVTSTDWTNWYALRDHSDAAPEIHELAELMGQAMDYSHPEQLYYGDWHLPYITPEEKTQILPGNIRVMDQSELKVLSAARCARLSFKPFDGNADYEKEVGRYEKLVVSQPVHASPTEHQATPDMMQKIQLGKGQEIQIWAQGSEQGNFTGWVQARKQIPHEALMDDHHNPEYYR